MDEPGQLQVQFARLSSDVEYIKKGVADLKVDMRRVNDRIGALDDKLGAVDARVYKVERDLTEKFGSLKLWALSLYVAQSAGMLLIMAKGFKWL